MDVTAIAHLATTLAQSRADQALGIAVVREALNIEKASAAALIEAISSTGGSDSNLGQLIDTLA